MKMQGQCTGPKYLATFFGKNEESNIWEDTIWLEEWTGREKF